MKKKVSASIALLIATFFVNLADAQNQKLNGPSVDMTLNYLRAALGGLSQGQRTEQLNLDETALVLTIQYQGNDDVFEDRIDLTIPGLQVVEGEILCPGKYQCSRILRTYPSFQKTEMIGSWEPRWAAKDNPYKVQDIDNALNHLIALIRFEKSRVRELQKQENQSDLFANP